MRSLAIVPSKARKLYYQVTCNESRLLTKQGYDMVAACTVGELVQRFDIIVAIMTLCFFDDYSLNVKALVKTSAFNLLQTCNV
jgi:hypothetical protein